MPILPATSNLLRETVSPPAGLVQPGHDSIVACYLFLFFEYSRGQNWAMALEILFL